MGMTEGEQIAALTVQVEHLTVAVNGLQTTVESLTAQANRWKGAFVVVLMLGGVMGWLANLLAGAWTR